MCAGPNCGCSKWSPVATPADAWVGFDPTTGITGPGVYLVTENCTFLATEGGYLFEAWIS